MLIANDEWIKFCVYEIVDTSEIGHICKMNYMDEL